MRGVLSPSLANNHVPRIEIDLHFMKDACEQAALVLRCAASVLCRFCVSYFVYFLSSGKENVARGGLSVSRLGQWSVYHDRLLMAFHNQCLLLNQLLVAGGRRPVTYI